MKGIEKITFITDEQRDLLIQSARQYKRYVRIYIEVVDIIEHTLYIKIKQMENQTDKYLSAKDLTKRALEVFEGVIPVGYELNIVAVPLKPISEVDLDYINKKKEELGLSDVDLSRLLNIRPENISRLMNGKRGLTKLGEAAFYYLFKYLEK